MKLANLFSAAQNFTGRTKAKEQMRFLKTVKLYKERE
tara:strand:+ start:717 stop:827 length:111 start_codon:yes stop_codon:yes gene_type:complete